MFHSFTGKSQKCISCYPAVEEGVQTQCVVNCIGKIRIFGFINPPEQVQEDNPIDYLVHVAKVAKPLYSQFGTGPNVYYIPPIHVPSNFLKQLFGPDVEQARSAYKNAGSDNKLKSLLVLLGSTDRIIRRFCVNGNEVTGYDESNKEIVKVPVQEPIYERPFFDKERNVYRHSIT